MMLKTITVDYDDPSALKRLAHNLLQRRKNILSQVGYTQISFNGSKTSIEKVLPVLEGILSSDLSKVYGNIGDLARRYYVYAHCDPTMSLDVKADIKHLFLAKNFPALRFVPFYIGKGTGHRFLDLSRNDSYRKVRSRITAAGKDVVVVKLRDAITEPESLALEAKIIDILGLRATSKNGLLVNLDEGEQPSRRRSAYPAFDGATAKMLQRNGYAGMIVAS